MAFIALLAVPVKRPERLAARRLKMKIPTESTGGCEGNYRMRTIRSVAGKIGRFVYARPMRVAWPGGVVSFTFDDFPKSALTVGAGILERYGARGTYYAAMGLAGSDGMLGPMFDHNDILAAHRAGHELACHTYSHLDCRGAAKSRIRNEIERNAAEFSALLSGYL